MPATGPQSARYLQTARLHNRAKRRVTPAIKRLMKRRAGHRHLKNGHRIDRNYMAHQHGDAVNPILAAAGYNFRPIFKWIGLLWLYFWVTLSGGQSEKTA